MQTFRTNKLTGFISLLLLASMPLLAQDWLSVGIKGGVPLTSPIENRTFAQTLGIPGLQLFTVTSTTGAARTFVIGPTVEMRLPLGFSLEADALYRQIHFSELVQTSSASPNFVSLQTTGILSRFNLWEFPVLAKYRLPVPILKPYVEAGPSFRAVSASLADRISGKGVTAGIGVEAHIGPLRIAPEVRYTHWGRDGASSNPLHSAAYPNEGEVLTGFSLASSRPLQPSSPAGPLKYLSLGVKGGMPFTDAFLRDEAVASTVCGNFSCPLGTNVSVVPAYSSRSYLVGPMLEVHLPANLSLEADGLYRPMELAVALPPSYANFLLGLSTPQAISTVHAWEFPIVGKYRFHSPIASPYLEAGTAFRTVSSLGPYLSKAALVAGLGVEARAFHLRIAPEVRFLHWGKDAPGTTAYLSRRNQAEFLLGLSY